MRILTPVAVVLGGALLLSGCSSSGGESYCDLQDSLEQLSSDFDREATEFNTELGAVDPTSADALSVLNSAGSQLGDVSDQLDAELAKAIDLADDADVVAALKVLREDAVGATNELAKAAASASSVDEFQLALADLQTRFAELDYTAIEAAGTTVDDYSLDKCGVSVNVG